LHPNCRSTIISLTEEQAEPTDPDDVPTTGPAPGFGAPPTLDWGPDLSAYDPELAAVLLERDEQTPQVSQTPRPVAGEYDAMLARVREPDGGFTYSPTLKTEPTEGYALSIYPERSVAIDAAHLKVKDLAVFVAANRDLLKKPGNHIGAWHDPASGKVFLDVSKITKSKKAARKLALTHDQIAYFDLKKKVSVTVNKDAKSGGAAGKK
jgi:hypothetical protein